MEELKIYDILNNKSPKMGHSRTLEAGIAFTKCDITGHTDWCILIDTSEGEYGYGCVSIEYINKQLTKIKNEMRNRT